MTTPDDDLDRLYQGPLDAFTEARNALAKTAKRPEVKKLEKPSLPAWTVNQLHWHHRPVIDRLEAAGTALLEQHHRLLSGASADIQTSEQAHREAVKQALAVARDVLRAAGHPDTPATLDAVRNTLQALPAAEAQGRLTRPLTPRGLEALAGLVLPARVPTAPAVTKAGATEDTGAAAREREAERFGARARDERARAQQREEAQRQAEAARAERERARQATRAAAIAALAAAEAALKDAETAVNAAERALAERQAERYAAHQAVARARRAAAD